MLRLVAASDMVAEIVVPVTFNPDGSQFVRRPEAPAGKRFKFAGMWFGETPGVVFRLEPEEGKTAC